MVATPNHEVAKDEGHHRDACRFLEQIATRMRVWTSARGDALNICGEGQTKFALPSPTEPSMDLLRGENGRCIQVGGYQRVKVMCVGKPRLGA